MKKILVIGIGSKIMTDDGIGVYLAEDLKTQITAPNIEFIIGECDFDYCKSHISDDAYLVVIDAYLSGKNVGEITIIPLSDLEKCCDNRYSMHGMHFLGQNDLNGIFIGIEPYDISYGFDLSDHLKANYKYIYNKVLKQIIKEERRMHDTFLLKRISESVSNLCLENKIACVKKLRIITSQNSHIQKDSLLEHLKELHSGLIGDWTDIIIDRQNIEDLTAVIDCIEGDIAR